MGSRVRPIAEAAWRAERARKELGNELREARLNAGLGLADIARAAGCSASEGSRYERGLVRRVDLELAARLLAAVGMDLSLRVCPASPPLHDRAHLALLQRFRARLHPSWRVRFEAALPEASDPRAWDALLTGEGCRIGVEAETRLRDLQALLRRIALKQRDSGFDRVVLLIAATRGNRATLREVRDLVREQLPLDSRTMLAALGAGRDPGASGVVLL